MGARIKLFGYRSEFVCISLGNLILLDGCFPQFFYDAFDRGDSLLKRAKFTLSLLTLRSELKELLFKLGGHHALSLDFVQLP